DDSIGVRAIVDGQWLGGVSRAGIWADDTSTEVFPGRFRRLAALVGYSRQFAVAPHQAIFVEAMAGTGGGVGGPPGDGRFLAGNAMADFLYQASDAPSLTNVPFGPLLRSLGTRDGVVAAPPLVQGGDGYWHANATIAFPIPQWSRPLIPEITLSGIPRADENC